MISLIIGGLFAYAIYINFFGSCAKAIQLGCFQSPNTLIIAFLLYVFIAYKFFVKKHFHLFMHRSHYRVKRLKFGFISIFLLLSGIGMMILFGVNLLPK